MKNRRIVVVAIMLVAALCLGVGYAAVTDSITATGKITYIPDLVLEWTGNVTGEGDNVITETTNGDTLAFTVDTSDWVKGQEYTYTVTVTNKSTKYHANGVAVSAVTNNASANYTVEAEIDDETIDANDTATVTIKITLDEYPITDTYEQTFTFTVFNNSVTAA